MDEETVDYDRDATRADPDPSLCPVCVGIFVLLTGLSLSALALALAAAYRMVCH